MTHSFPFIPERIQWHEGMLLAPQHFQQIQARTDALTSWHALAAAPLAWGVRHLEIDPGLLANGLLRILALDAVMADGTAVWHDASCADHGTLELDLSERAQALELTPQDIWLTLPRSRIMHNPGAPSRFTSISMPPVEDEVSQAVEADLPRIRPTLGLAVGAMPAALWQNLRLGSALKDNKQIRLSSDLPPLMLLARSHPLWVRSWQLATELRSKAAFVARQMQVPSSRTEDRLTTLEQRERLRSLLQGLAPLEAVLQTQPLHPHALYLVLCSLLGPLAMLRPGALSLLPPAFDQARPSNAFGPLLDTLEEAIAEISQDHLLHLFEFVEGNFTLDLQPDWATPRLVIGLRGKPEKDLTDWMESAVIGAQSAWASLRERRVLGAPRQRIEAAPELGVRTSSGYTLFAVETPDVLMNASQKLVVSNNNKTYAPLRPQELVLFVKGQAA
jgi:type VI secretion system protein ImpJ